MSPRSDLEQAADVFKRNFPGMTPEAVVCFLVLIDQQTPSIDSVAAETRMAVDTVRHHLSLLSQGGAGLLDVEDLGGGRTLVRLTPTGQQVRATVQSVLQ